MDASSDHPIQEAPMVDWSSLPADIIKDVGDCILSTDDVDYYMNLRAVCHDHDWRAATDDPKAHPADHRFRLQQWILLDERTWRRREDEETTDGERLFLNTTTGRFLRKCLPHIVDFYFITSTGGLLVHASRSSRLHATRIVNPLTASCLNFMVPMPISVRNTTAILQPFGSSLTLVLDMERAYLDRPDAELFAMVEYDMAYKVRMIWGIDGENKIGDLVRSITAIFPDEMRRVYRGHHFLISGGDMLFVILRPHRPGVDVFKVDNKRNVIEPVRCIGGRALFLGDRCVPVDANKFPSVDGDHVFYLSGDGIHMYDLIKDEEEVADMDTAVLVMSGLADRSRPPSIIQLLIIYCTNTPWSQLVFEMIGGRQEALY